MYIIHIASELAPLAKVGGLGDVILGLCRELSWKGHDIDIILPKYDCMNSDEIRDFSIYMPNLMSYYEGEWHSNTIWMGWVENLKVYFIEPHHPAFFFNRGCFYGCDDDVDRYLYFSRAAIEFIFKKQLNPDILHLHDWQSSVIAPLCHEIYQPLGLTKPKIVFTIHNIDYQGKCTPQTFEKVGLEANKYKSPDAMQDEQDSSLVNLLKGGIVFSDYVTTVSPNYAKEVMTPLGGRSLDKVLIKYADKFSGVLNGIDYSFWNPEIDRYLPAHYSSREVPANKKDFNTIDKKAYIKTVLREKFSLEDSYRPIIGCVTRLVPQKGIEMIEHTLNYAIDHNSQFVLLGSGPIPEINQRFHKLSQKYSDHPNVSLILHHQEELAHLIYAASDMFIVPSIFEPCGLTQMIALKYGSIPIVRKTGGLADTIFDVDYSGKPFDETNGYSFDYPDATGIESALSRAIDCWFHHPEKWRHMMVNGMKIDFSWNIPSNKYVEIYEKLIKSDDKQHSSNIPGD